MSRFFVLKKKMRIMIDISFDISTMEVREAETMY